MKEYIERAVALDVVKRTSGDIWRSPLKGNQAQDLDKALFYLNRLREKVKE